jgi:hypothetical protein
VTEVPDCRDLSQAHRVIVDGIQFDDNVTLINCDDVIIWKIILFKTIEAMKIWLAGYAVFHHRPFVVKYLDENKRYVVICRRGYPWIVHSRK